MPTRTNVNEVFAKYINEILFQNDNLLEKIKNLIE